MPNDMNENIDETSQETTTQQDDSNLTKDSYLKEDVNRLLRQSTSELRRENDSLKKELNEYSSKMKEFSEFQSSMQEAIKNAGLKFGENGLESEEEEEEPDFLEEYSNVPRGVNPKLWKDFKRFEIGTNRLIEHLTSSNKDQSDKIESLMKAIEGEKKERQQIEDRARNAERVSLLDDALEKANCVDLEGGRRYFRDQTIWINGRGWMFVPPDSIDESDYIPVREGIKKYIPSYLVKTAARQGGSGSTSSGDTTVNPSAELNQLRSQAENLFKEAQGGNPTAQQRYMVVRRQIRELERKQASAG